MLSSRSKEKSKIQNLYLEDRPTTKDKFRYDDIAISLEETLKQADFPTHISLMGEWGSGKSTVLKLLKDKLDKSKEFSMESISVWKFSDNSTSLQRKIIREIQTTLKIKDNNGLDIIEESQEASSATGFLGVLYSLSFKSKSLIFTTCISLMILFFVTFLVNSIYSNWILSFLAAFGVEAILASSLIFTIFNSKIKVQLKNTYKNLPLDYGDQFEEKFKNAVNKFLDREKKKKLILVFDDLDRLPPNQLYSTLNTIKTFLYSENCAFIVPCDEKVLRMELKTAFNQQNYNSDVSEFLNKTFDVIIKLPQVEHTNMKVFAENLLEEEEISWFLEKEVQNCYRNILSILIHSEIDTPRRVKKILNAFGSDWYIAKLRDNKNATKILTKDPEILAIYTVIKTNYLDFYEIIQENPMIFKDKESVNEIEDYVEKLLKEREYIKKDIESEKNKENIKEKESDKINVGKLIPSLFLSRVFDRIKERYDPRPYLYFSNQDLNPITSIKELNDLKEIALSGDVKGFKSNFGKLLEDQKESFVDSIIPEFYSDDETINGLKCLFSYPESFAYINRSRSDWEYNFTQFIGNVIDSAGLQNTTESLNQMNSSNIAWNALSEYTKNNNMMKELTNTWISKPYLYDRFTSFNLGEIIEENYQTINKAQDNYYYLPSIIIDLPNDHSMVRAINWGDLFIECLKVINNKNAGIKKRNKEKEKEKDKENEEPKESLIPTKLPFNIMDWINNISNKTDISLKGQWLYSFTSLYNLESQEILSGIGDFWGVIVSNTTDVNEINYITKALAELNKVEDLFDKNVWIALNNKISGGLNSEDIENHVIDFIDYIVKNKIEIFKQFIPAMKDVKVVMEWCTNNYKFDNTEIDAVKEATILHNAETIDPSILFENASDSILERQIPVISSINRLLLTSPSFYKYGQDEGYFEKWFNVTEDDVLDIEPEEELIELLGFYSYLQRDKNEYVIKVTSIIKYLLSHRDYLANVNSVTPTGTYKTSWNSHIEVLFKHLLEHSEYLEWDVTLKELQNVALKNNPNESVSIVSHLNSTVFELAIPIVSDKTVLSDRDVNSFLSQRVNVENEKHLNVLATRWYYFNQEEKEQLFRQIKEPGKDEYFIDILISKLAERPRLEYIDELIDEEFKDKDKQRIMQILIDNTNVTELNNWLSNLFEDISSPISLWHYKSSLYMINRGNVNPEIKMETVRDALSYSDERTIIALEIIPLIFAKKDKNKLKPYLRQKILEIETQKKSQHSELATKVKNHFGWQNRWQKVSNT